MVGCSAGGGERHSSSEQHTFSGLSLLGSFLRLMIMIIMLMMIMMMAIMMVMMLRSFFPKSLHPAREYEVSVYCVRGIDDYLYPFPAMCVFMCLLKVPARVNIRVF